MNSPPFSNTKQQHRRRTKEKIDDIHHQYGDNDNDILKVLKSIDGSISTTDPNEIGINNQQKLQTATTTTTTTLTAVGLKSKLWFFREILIAACILTIIWAYGYDRILSTTTTNTLATPVACSGIKINTTDDGKSQFHDSNNTNVDDVIPTMIEEGGNVIETIEIPWNDLGYRRVCTNVGLHSILCMTVRFPFQYAAPDNKSKTRRPILPVAEEFYKLDKTNVYHIQYNDWLKCTNDTNFNSPTNDPLVIPSLEDAIIRQCLTSTAYEVARKRHDKNEPVITFWTRERRMPASPGTTETTKSTIYFHGTGHTDAVNRIYQFFGNDHELIVMGASPAPGVTQGLSEMLGTSNCHPTFVHKRPNYNCINQLSSNNTNTNNGNRHLQQQGLTMDMTLQEQQQNSRRLDAITREFDLPFSTLNESQINIGIIDYRSVGGNGQHELPNGTVVEHLSVLQRKPGWTTLRNFTLFIEYQMAHIQTQDMLQKNIQKVYELQDRLPSQFMDVQSPAGKEQLKKQGYAVQNIIAFDGQPQYYPTETSGWATTMFFLSTDGFKIPISTTTTYNITPVAYANICVGPLPKNSLLREINLLNRRRFHELGIKPQFYGRTWEFVNLFWWQMKMYHGKGPGEAGLDCTHNYARDGINGIHRFFVQAMVDDYFENQ